MKNGGRSYFTNCFVNGTVDYIFGNGTAFFNSCTLNCAGNIGTSCTVTAANTSPQTAVDTVFSNCTITGNPTPTSEGGNAGYQSGIPAGNAYLGRAWQYTTSNASVTFINTKMSTVVNAARLGTVETNEKPTKTNPRFSEYNSMNSSGGTLSVSGRVSWSNQLVNSGNSNKLLDASNYTTANVFGPSRSGARRTPPRSRWVEPGTRRLRFPRLKGLVAWFVDIHIPLAFFCLSATGGRAKGARGLFLRDNPPHVGHFSAIVAQVILASMA